MADFSQALQLVLAHEGGYVNDPSDPGGETYKGVARNMFGKWGGWTIIDQIKKQPNFQVLLDKSVELQKAVEDFYYMNFWKPINGDTISNQDIANSIFDFGVNAGVSTSVTLAQKVVNVQSDGIIGPASIQAINTFDPKLFMASFTLSKINRYVSIVKKNPDSKKYFYGWVCRSLGV